MRNPSGLEAVILCGGLGTRLREETEYKPKPMVEIGGRPILWHIMKTYAAFGVRDFVLCLGYRGDRIRDYFLNYRHRQADLAVELSDSSVEVLGGGDVEDWRVVLADTGAETQTGGRIKRALRYVRGERFFATYGDGVADVDIGRLLAFHERAGRAATVTAVRPSSRYGEIVIDAGVVRTFQEKPQVNDGWINGGYFVFERRAFDHVSMDPRLTLESDVIPDIVGRGDLAAYPHEGFWQCMDTYREMVLLNDLWARGQAPWQPRQAEGDDRVRRLA
ncbi:MAG: glucose-1-phosphate cytidylyltransferase [Alphaproteobacteria bacterium]|nr:glucose-1-phosphate cytidylyltransferase [Alphaproteobacteria bacterium]